MQIDIPAFEKRNVCAIIYFYFTIGMVACESGDFCTCRYLVIAPSAPHDHLGRRHREVGVRREVERVRRRAVRAKPIAPVERLPQSGGPHDEESSAVLLLFRSKAMPPAHRIRPLHIRMGLEPLLPPPIVHGVTAFVREVTEGIDVMPQRQLREEEGVVPKPLDVVALPPRPRTAAAAVAFVLPSFLLVVVVEAPRESWRGLRNVVDRAHGRGEFVHAGIVHGCDETGEIHVREDDGSLSGDADQVGVEETAATTTAAATSSADGIAG